MRTNLKFRLANRTDITNAQLDTWLNEGLLDLATRVRVRQLETEDATKVLVAGAHTVTMPTNMIAALDIRNATQNIPMLYIEWTKLRQIRIVTGTPRQWSVWGGTIYLDKDASAADSLNIFGIIRPSWGAGDAATPGIDDELEYGIYLLAAKHAWVDLGDIDRANMIEDAQRPGTGEFWVWVRANKLPTVQQSMANQFRQGVQVRMEGYGVID